MIRKMRHRFIRIALIALTVAMILVTGVVNLINWLSVRSELRETLGFLTEFADNDNRGGAGSRITGKNKHARNLISESNWFSVTFDAKGSIRSVNLMSAADLDEETAADLAVRAMQRSFTDSAFLDDYLYLVRDERSVIFLNCETKLTAVRTLALISGAACVAGILLAWLIVSLASRRAIAPTLRSMEQQKQFITNASHELKTPLTVISTNMQLMQMETPDNPWVRSTQKQTAQMRHLVEELVYLSRMEEESPPLAPESLALNQLLAETAEPFADMAEFAGKTLTVKAEEPVQLTGDRASLQRMISTLLDNAVKYAAPESELIAETKTDGRYAVLRVSNAVTEPLTKEQCELMFNRFYRADASRSKEKQSGFGIGLAIAAAVAEKHGGQLSAAMENGQRLVLTCRLPRNGKG